MKASGKEEDSMEKQFSPRVLILTEFPIIISKVNGEMESNADKASRNGVMERFLKVSILTIKNMDKVNYN